MNTDTRPALTARWRELERRGWKFRLHLRRYNPYECELIGERDGEVYTSGGTTRPIYLFWEEHIVNMFEHWTGMKEK